MTLKLNTEQAPPRRGACSNEAMVVREYIGNECRQ
jgi:hypothetical protein